MSLEAEQMGLLASASDGATSSAAKIQTRPHKYVIYLNACVPTSRVHATDLRSSDKDANRACTKVRLDSFYKTNRVGYRAFYGLFTI